jgi:hypothetical protein
MLDVIAQWGPFGGVCGLCVLAFFQRWVVAWGTVKVLLAGKDELIAMYRDQAEANALARDVAAAALAKSNAELPAALHALAASKRDAA